MYRFLGLSIAFSMFAAFAASGEEAPKEGAVYVKLDYMQLTDAMPIDYFRLEMDEWRAVHAQRLRNGVTLAWYFYEMMPGARRDDDQPYDYITVSVYESLDKLEDEGNTEAIFDVYPGMDLQVMYDRADESRDLVRADIWRLEGTAADAPWGKPAAPYLLFRFLKGDGEDAEAWGPVHRERIGQGHLKNAGRYRLANPEDEARPYTHGVIEYFDGLRDILAPVDEAVVAAAHPGLAAEAAAALINEREAGATLYKTQIWRLIDSMNPDSLEQD